MVGRAINKYGWENIVKEVLCVVSTLDEANECERYYIQHFDTLIKNSKGYNISEGGSNGNKFAGWSKERFEEYKIKQRNKQLGKNSKRYGVKHKEDTIIKMKEKAIINNPFKNKRHSEETKRKWNRKRGNNGNSKKVVVIDNNNILTFDTLIDASEYMNISYNTIRNYLSRGKNTYKHFKFYYKGEKTI